MLILFSLQPHFVCNPNNLIRCKIYWFKSANREKSNGNEYPGDMLTEVNSIHFGAYFGAARYTFLIVSHILIRLLFLGGKERGCSIIFQFVLCLIVKPLLTWNICFCRLTWILHFICVRFGRQSTALLFLHHRLTKLILMFGHVITI